MSVRLVGYGNPRIGLVADPGYNAPAPPAGSFARASVGTDWSAARVLTTYAANVPRIGYDPQTGRLRGLLIEAGVTNWYPTSEDFSGFAAQGANNWGPTAGAPPDVRVGANVLFTRDSSYGDGTWHMGHAVRDWGSVANYTYRAGVFRPGSLANIALAANYLFEEDTVGWVLPARQLIYTYGVFQDSFTWGAVNLGDGWVLLWISRDWSNSASYWTRSADGCLGGFLATPYHGTDAPDGATFYGAHWQAVPGPRYPTSLILTAGATQARDSDIATFPASIGSAAAGALLCTWTPEWHQFLLTGEIVLTSEVYDSGDYFAVTADATHIYAVLSVGGTVFRASQAASLAMLTEHWAFGSFDGTTLKLTLDGAPIVSTAAAVTPSGTPTEFGLGSLNGAQQADSWLRNVYYGKSAPTDAAMLAEDTTGMFPLILDGALTGVTA